MTIQIENLTFSYPESGENVFENLSLNIETDWRTGLIGRNGRGKTTLLRLLKGDFKGEYSGRIVCPNADYFPCDTGDGNAVALELLTERCGAEEWRIFRELSLLDVSAEALYRPFSTLSGGEQTKALLAAMFLKEGNFLLIDEPTNHIDNAAKSSVAAYLKTKRGFLLVSHDRELLNACVDHVVELNAFGVQISGGNYDVWKEEKEKQERAAMAKNEKITSEVKRLKESARVKAEWSKAAEKGKFTRNSGLRPDRGYVGHKAAKEMKSAKVIEARKDRAIEEKKGLLQNIEERERLKICPLEFYTEKLLEVKRMQVNYGDTPVFAETSFSVLKGDRVALNGRNGCGKSSLIKAIVGELPFTGELLRPPQLKISYVAQDESEMKGSLDEYAYIHGVDGKLFRAVLAALGFCGKELCGDVSALSAGQKKKVAIARSLSERAHLYVWDEPLNFVDVLSREQIEELVLSFRPTLLFVEHDAAFRKAVATRIVEIIPRE